MSSDNGSEFVNSMCDKFLKEKGVAHQRIWPYTPQQNGVVERKHRHILEVPRIVIFQGQIPLRYWGPCVLAGTKLIPRRVLGGKSPFESCMGLNQNCLT